MADKAVNTRSPGPAKWIHGSGIDTGWTIEKVSTGWICASDWHAMDLDGSYVGYIPFRLTLDRKGMLIKVALGEATMEMLCKENVDGHGEPNVCFDDLDDYLVQTWNSVSRGYIKPSDEWARAIDEDALVSGDSAVPKVYFVKIK